MVYVNEPHGVKDLPAGLGVLPFADVWTAMSSACASAACEANHPTAGNVNSPRFGNIYVPHHVHRSWMVSLSGAAVCLPRGRAGVSAVERR
jgi:hypothetical protein